MPDEPAASDPFSLAVKAVMRDLRRDNAVDYVREQYRVAEEERRKSILKDKGLHPSPTGPKEWSPNKEKREDEIERIIERETDKHPNEMTLYLTFDDFGGFQGWTVDYPDYWQGHGGPTASVLVSESLDYDDIKSAIEDALSDLDWDEIKEKLEEEDDGA